MGCAFVDNDTDFQVGLYLRDLEVGNVENCYFVRNKLEFSTGTRQLIAERNLLLDTTFVDQGSSNEELKQVYV